MRGLLARWSVLGGLAGAPPVVRLLVLTQLAFNVGFYLVVPFLAVHLLDDLALAGWLVGLVLGLRTASQQGLFIVGGALADRWGTRPVVLLGCGTRVVGFVVLGLATSLPGVLVGAMLTGVAAAMFSPAVESALAVEAAVLERAGTTTRSDVFALFAVAGEVGAVTGPALGAVLLAVGGTAGFPTACLVAAGVFVVVLLTHARLLPRRPAPHAADGIFRGWTEVARNRPFVLFALGWSAYLLCYNQLYLLLPASLTASTGSAAAVGWLFALAAVLIVVGQVPTTRWARRRLGPTRAVVTGMALLAAAFVVPGVLTLLPGPALAPAVALVVLLTAGQVLAVPFGQELVARLAGERRLGTYYGALASAGGVAVLLGSVATGLLVPLLGRDGPAGAAPFLVVALVPFAGAVLLASLARRGRLDPALEPAVPEPSVPEPSNEEVQA